MDERRCWLFLLFFLVCATLCAFGRRCPAEEGQPETTGLPLAVTPVKLDREGIIKELTDFSLAGMNQRLGPDYAHYHPKGPEKPFPDIYLAPAKQGPTGRRYQLGGPWTTGSGDYSSTQGQVLYVPDNGFGVDRVMILEWAHPTWITYEKGSNETFIAACRGDREIVWFRYTGDYATVVRRLRDTRLIDPVYVEKADTHGTEAAIITVADFRGRKILNYRYSDAVFATNGGARFGMGADGKAEFECGGILEFPGSPFCVSATNVN